MPKETEVHAIDIVFLAGRPYQVQHIVPHLRQHRGGWPVLFLRAFTQVPWAADSRQVDFDQAENIEKNIEINVDGYENSWHPVSEMKFEWDGNKERANAAKHGVDFEAAKLAFFDPKRVVVRDENHSETEDRFICIWAGSHGSVHDPRQSNPDHRSRRVEKTKKEIYESQ